MNLRLENTTLTIPGEDAVRVLREIEVVLISLHKIGSYYAQADLAEKSNYDRETVRFLDEWNVCERLARARAILTAYFDHTLADDDMDDLERELASVDSWSSPRSRPSGHR